MKTLKEKESTKECHSLVTPAIVLCILDILKQYFFDVCMTQTHQAGFLKDCVSADRRKKLQTFLKPTLMLEYKDVNMKPCFIYWETKFSYHWGNLHRLHIKAAERHNKQHSMNAVKAVQPLPSLTPLTANIIQPVHTRGQSQIKLIPRTTDLFLKQKAFDPISERRRRHESDEQFPSC